ncbi:kicB killing factor family protein, partial [Vibrio cholerae CP1035(8)]
MRSITVKPCCLRLPPHCVSCKIPCKRQAMSCKRKSSIFRSACMAIWNWTSLKRRCLRCK